MPVNKAAYLRHEIIDDCLRNGMRKWSKEDILQCINSKLRDRYGADNGHISEASLRKDLEDMESEYGAPIEKYRDGRKFYYRYQDKEYSIKNLPVNNEDLAKLNLAVHILQQIQGFNLADEMAEVVQKLEKKVKLSSNKKSVIAFENAPSAQGTENLGDIYEAILNERVLKISYKHFKAMEPAEQVIHPYYLKEFNNRWFLFGWSDLNKRIEIMALDRMVKISVTSGMYHPNCFHPDTYFAHLIGVTDPGTPVEKIQLCFAKDRAPYIITRRIHTSQVNAPCENGNVNIELDLKVNRELLALILAYGDDVDVFAPESLRLTIKEVHQRALEKYKVEKIA